jgi:hypothetical protein
LAEEFASESDISFYRELYNLFHVADIGPNQEAILRHRWLRIYTTNYDDAVEVCHHDKFGTAIQTYATVDSLQNKLDRNSVITCMAVLGG